MINWINLLKELKDKNMVKFKVDQRASLKN